MKKPGIWILVLITGVFAAFIVGFFAGRNLNRTPVQIQQLPAVTEATEITEETEDTTPTEPGIIDINTATAAQLQTLPGIGEVIAQRIIDYRESHGPFRSVGELTRVEGIGQKRLEAIRDLVTAGG